MTGGIARGTGHGVVWGRAQWGGGGTGRHERHSDGAGCVKLIVRHRLHWYRALCHLCHLSRPRRMHPDCSSPPLTYLHSLTLRSPSVPPLSPPHQVGSSKGQLAQLHPACSGIREDDDGLLPEWVIYHELVATSKPFLRQASVEKCVLQ